MKRSLTLIGMGEDGFDGLSAAARTLIGEADIVVGSGRLLALLPPLGAALHNWPTPFDPMIERIRSWSDRNVVLLATGDPMNYGVGALLAPRMKDELTIIPSSSAFSLAAARLGWSLPDVETISLHGRDAALLEPLVAPGSRIIALTEGAETVRAVAEMLCRRKFGRSVLSVLEHMGGPHEKRAEFHANDLPDITFSKLTTLTIECRAEQDAMLLPRVPGLPDDAFDHDGQITKRDIRAMTISALQPMPEALLWDIGAGCGSIAIEWMRSARRAMAIAFEPDPSRRQRIAKNAVRLGTPGVEIVAGHAPKALIGKPAPDAVFHGGAISDPDIFQAAWQILRPGGRYVANAVTLEGEAALAERQGRHGGEILRVDLSIAEAIGTKRVMRPKMAVTQWRVVKPWQ